MSAQVSPWVIAVFGICDRCFGFYTSDFEKQKQKYLKFHTFNSNSTFKTICETVKWKIGELQGKTQTCPVMKNTLWTLNSEYLLGLALISEPNLWFVFLLSCFGEGEPRFWWNVLSWIGKSTLRATRLSNFFELSTHKVLKPCGMSAESSYHRSNRQHQPPVETMFPCMLWFCPLLMSAPIFYVLKMKIS